MLLKAGMVNLRLDLVFQAEFTISEFVYFSSSQSKLVMVFIKENNVIAQAPCCQILNVFIILLVFYLQDIT